MYNEVQEYNMRADYVCCARSSSAVLRDLPIAPKKPVSPFNGKIDFNSGM